MAESIRPAKPGERLAGYFDSKYAKSQIGDVSAFLKAELEGMNILTLKGGTALDVGCGNGANALFMASSGIFSSVEGIDISKVGIEKAREAARRQNITELNLIAENFMQAGLNGNYSLILVSNVLEYVSETEKRAFMEKVMDLTKPGGVNVLCFATSLPRDFVGKLLEHKETVDNRVPIRLFQGSDGEKASSLPFESGLLDMYKEAGWSVIKVAKYEGERNFVSVQITAVIMQKPLAEDITAKRD